MRLATLLLCAGLGCSDSNSSQSHGSNGTGGSTGTGGSAAPSDKGICGCGSGDVTLECVCGRNGCDAYEARLKAALDCSHPTPWFDPQWSPVHHGCGLVSISIGNGLVGTMRVYRESDHELVGASNYSDDGTGCETGNVDLSACPDHSDCLPCTDGLNGLDMCPEEESDGGL